jgi:sortase A
MTIRLRGPIASRLSSTLYVAHLGLLTAGLALVGWPLAVYAESEYVQWSASREFQGGGSSAKPPSETIVPNKSFRAKAAPKNPPGTPLGKFSLERLGISYVLLEGTDARTLDKSIGHVEGTSFPGETGNIGVAGHRNTHFRKLEWVRRGDVIRIQTKSDEYRYNVEWVGLYTPSDLEVLDPKHGPAVTLITCFPFEYVGSAPQRFIVRALPDAATKAKLDVHTPANP